LRGAEHEVIPDRIEAATFAIAAAATGGEVTIHGARADLMHAVLDKLREAGVKIERNGPALLVKRGRSLKPVDVTTLPYAGFPTDCQAQIMALMTLTHGISIVTERIFESRFMHVSELARLGADIAIEGPSAIVKGGKPLSGAPIMASDLRASAALVIAGMTAKGQTLVKRIYHLDRGYENIDEKLRRLGAGSSGCKKHEGAHHPGGDRGRVLPSARVILQRYQEAERETTPPSSQSAAVEPAPPQRPRWKDCRPIWKLLWPPRKNRALPASGLPQQLRTHHPRSASGGPSSSMSSS
jgi:hypothetical protein